jgi:hypothetical protein
VSGYPTSQTRRVLFDGWAQFRTTVGAIVPLTSEWIGGGFVEDKVDPADIDVCTLIDGPTWDTLPISSRQGLALLVGPHGKALYGCDAYPLFIYPQGHQYHPVYLSLRGYWDDLWGQTRQRQPKGYLEVR